MTEQDDRFFNKQFWRMTLIAATSQLIVLVIAITASLVIGGKLDKVIQLSDSLNQTMVTFVDTVETVMGVDPEAVQEKAEALRESAITVGEGAGDGGAETVNRIGEALRNWQKNRNDGN